MRAIIISEALNFQRNIDPKLAMGTGDLAAQAKAFLQPYINALKIIKKWPDFKDIKRITFHAKDDKRKIFDEFNQFYIEFIYKGRYISIGLDDDNIIQIDLKPLSPNKIRNLIISYLIDY